MAMVHKVTLSLVYKVTLFLVYKVTLSSVYEAILPSVCIETTKAIISFQVNIKPTRSTTSTLRTHQVYQVS